MFLDGERVVRSTLHGRVVGDDHAAHAAHEAYAAYDACGRQRVCVHLVGRQSPDFQPRRFGVEEPRDAFAREELAAAAMALTRLLAPSRVDVAIALAQIGGERVVRREILGELRRVRIDLAAKRAHRVPAVAANSSRPISMRLISLVPAPIS